MKNILVLSFLAVMLIVSSSCENCEDPSDPLCDNYDPCFEVEPTQSDFTISLGYTSPGFEIFFESDTVLYGSIYFKSNVEDAISYKWTVGTDTRTWDTPDLSLLFDDDDSSSLRNNPVSVTLVVERQPNDCFLDDDDIDTITKVVHFRSEWEAAFLGNWVGSRDTAPNDSYQLRISRESINAFQYEDYIYNMYGEGTDCYHRMENNMLRSYREAYNNSQGRPENWETCGRSYYSWTRKLRIYVNTEEDTILMTWEEWHSDNDDVELLATHTFKGRRPS